MAREITDFTKGPLTKQFQAKGNSGSDLIESIQPVTIVHDLEGGPNRPFVRFTVEGTLAAVAAQLAVFSIRLVNPLPSPPVEQLLVIDSIWADVPWQAGLGGNLIAFDTPISTQTCRDHDLRRAQFDTGISQWKPSFLDDIVVLQGNNTSNRVLQSMARGPANFITPVAIVFPRRQYLESVTGLVPTLIVTALTVNTTMSWCVSGRLFSVAP